ncbi:hypothetical protein [Lewinella sp. IMCC34183]|uniref:hypothetical protein n=1 Tax=Lewinella sp. IMCC34183 TaxID=2248762 RepID=UPI000E27DB7F|nr:hypothetical protein [Lewinella sp. IMCC34183]
MSYRILSTVVIFLLFTATASGPLRGQSSDLPAHGPAYVDDQGVIRWSRTDAEVHGFGVNYTVPFAHAYRSAERLGVDPLRAIDRDVYHFARMGFDLYRIHVWDTEISDTLGNLIFNRHLNAFDYLLAELAKRDINYVLTPIAFWGNGWPEPDEDTPGFSHRYGKAASLTDEAAIRAQENYLTQFMNHVNPYTGVAYRDDPRLIAVEISNEPHHRGTAAEVTRFVRRMVEAVRASGTEKPVFYNISHSVQRVPDYFAGGINGGTFQWYPAGLVYGEALPVNALPYVDDYAIPFDSVVRANGGAKIVYEFDPADIDHAYPYPAMARSFRSAGIQLATHFAYDPTFLAYANTEYNTHYMNLAYTPAKAIGLMIAGEVFHRVPRYADFGAYPRDTTFGDFTVSYRRDLALLNAAETYYYSGDVAVGPRAIDSLLHLAGTGSSPVVTYDGTGAYFLDRLDAATWRLEVMPDAFRVGNAYGSNSPDKAVTVLQHNLRGMSVRLPGLAGPFTVSPVTPGNDHAVEVAGDSFAVRPGVYLLGKPDATATWPADRRVGNRLVGEYGGPAGRVDRTYLTHEAPSVAVAGRELHIEVRATTPNGLPDAVTLVGAGGPPIKLTHRGGFTYTGTVPADRMMAGYLTYFLTVAAGDSVRTFPADAAGSPYAWDFYADLPYRIRVVPEGTPLRLFDAGRDFEKLAYSRWLPSLSRYPVGAGGEDELHVTVEELAPVDPENTTASPVADYTIAHFLDDRLPATELPDYSTLVVTGRSLSESTETVQVALVLEDGTSYAAPVTLTPERREHLIPLSRLRREPTVTMPRPYPSFLPYYFESETPQPFDLSAAQTVQIRIGPGLSVSERTRAHGIGIGHIDLR